MFVQVIEGTTRNAAALKECLERWQTDLRPGATGFLGSTEGVGDDGEVMIFVRFADRRSAMANSERPEQGEWWAEVEGLFDEPPNFHETDDVTEMRHGDLQRAQFVQVMEGHVTDRMRAQDLEVRADETLLAMRPDLLGMTTAFFDDGDYASLAYFTSEHEARRNESIPMPEDLLDQFRDWGDAMPVERYIDLRDPMMMPAEG